VKGGTNVQTQDLANAGKTNVATLAKNQTNSIPPQFTARPGTNNAALAEVERSVTNATAPSELTKVDTNLAPSLMAIPQPAKIGSKTTIGTSEPIIPGTNLVAAKSAAPGTNLLTLPGSGTNATARSTDKRPYGPSSRPDMAIMAMAGMPGMGGKKLPELPPPIKARIDRIYESELLGQVMRPMPMALLGIAGNAAFLRSPSGQTGMVKEGDSLGEIKLVRIGINRVLVEENGQQKELMLFNGYGSESLLKKETPDETTPK
jgi:hypothetical protein